MDGRAHIGTSGWYYDHWKGPFYPTDVKKRDYFAYFVTKFQTVEVNNSFYNLPSESTFEKWRESSPQQFIFSLKAGRYITHFKRLLNAHESVGRFLERASILEEKLGPILFQLPPRWPFDQARLKDFLEALPSNHKFTFEFRDTRWLNDSSYQLLSDYNAALCLFDFAGRETKPIVTTDFVYARLHGPGGPYQGQYSDEELTVWAKFFNEQLSANKSVYCYFDNDESGFAAKDAARLMSLIRA